MGVKLVLRDALPCPGFDGLARMPILTRRWGLFALLATLLAVPPVAVLGDDSEGERLYREKVAPLLRAECYSCHSAGSDKLKAGLRVDTRAALLAGGDTGPAIEPGKSSESLLVQALRHQDGLEMPPKKARLPEAVVRDVARWIDLGAPESAEVGSVVVDPLVEARKHWAFQPVQRFEPPQVHRADWVLNPIDAFILAQLEERGWQPAPDAERRDWLRRVTFDLTGLPPTPQEIASFLNDERPGAEARVVDRLLDSPRYGERWAQHWLDVVRYAESEGFEYDRHIPDAWRFRDYVIDAFNGDKPFDRFVMEQIAGDELDPNNPECLSASIFHRLGPVRRNAGNAEIALSRNEVLTERTDIIGTAFLGLSVGCARCHNHKLEPISQKDYYRLEAYLAATDEHDISLASEAETRAWNQRTTEVKEKMNEVRAQMRKSVGQERDRLAAQLEVLEDQLPAPLPTIPATHNNVKKRTEIHVLKRGMWESKGDVVAPRPPSVLISDGLDELPADVTDPRTRLARWLTAPANPLTARVIVNRVWQHHFGAGLVKTVNDFGTHGAKPSHPELLDWLTSTFLESGWRLKPLHRQIVLSRTYRQASRSPVASEAEKLDPENRLLWKFPRRRLTAEEIRDAMLAASGRLSEKTGGPSVMVPVDPALVKLLYKPLQWRVTPDASEHDRRTIYLIAKRNLRLPFLEAFDAPALQTGCPRRESSTHAPQALELLNGTLSNDLADAFAQRLVRETQGDPATLVDRAFLLALGRTPTDVERTLSLDYLHDQPLKEFALALFNLNGFLYVP